MTVQTTSDLAASSSLRTLIGMNHSLLTKNLEGVTEAAAGTAPGAGNAIAWSLGHIVYWRQAALGMLGAQPVWSAGECDGFKGTSRDLPATIDRDWNTLLAAYRESHARLLRALEAAPPTDGDAVRGLTQLQCHETYHIGQIALARRVVGLPGAI